MRKYLMFLLIGFGLLLISCNNPDNTTSSKENVSNTTTTNSDKTSTTSIPSSNTTTINSFGTNITGDITTDFPWEE